MTGEQVKRRARGVATLNRILEHAVHIASVEGLEAMSLATLARATGMSKSGLFAHFKSKQALQLAIIDEAERMFDDVVVKPVVDLRGVARVERLLERFINASLTLFRGGSFFISAAHEMDGRPGAVRTRLEAHFARFRALLEQSLADVAADNGSKNVDVEPLVFAVHGIAMSANLDAQLRGDTERARTFALRALAELLRRRLR